MCNMVLVSDEKAEKRGEGDGVFSAQFSEMFIFNIHSYNRDLR